MEATLLRIDDTAVEIHPRSTPTAAHLFRGAQVAYLGGATTPLDGAGMYVAIPEPDLRRNRKGRQRFGYRRMRRRLRRPDSLLRR